MKELAVVPWEAVNANMTDEYREKVVEVALERLPKASKSLQRFAARALSTVSIPGFRSLSHAPERIAKRYIIKEMLTSNHITAAVICLWGDAKKNGPILDLSRTAGNYGWRIRADWTWEEARAG